MTPLELASGLALVVVLTGLAIFFGWRQRQTQLLLKQNTSPLERDFLRGQVRRRTLCCVLLLLFAAVLVGWVFLAGDFSELGPIAAAAKAAQDADEEADWARESLWFYTGYWIFALVLLMVIVFLAAIDFLATARYGLKRQRKLLNDHQALLALEAARLQLQKRQEMD
jgi:hypothetical protein